LFKHLVTELCLSRQHARADERPVVVNGWLTLVAVEPVGLLQILLDQWP